MVSCAGDSSKSASTPGSNQINNVVENTAEPDPHAGHNHAEGEGHHNTDKPVAIENNSHVRVPAEKPVQSAPTYVDPVDNTSKTKSQMQVEFKDKLQKSSRPIPNACKLVSDAFIAKVIGIDKDAINIKDGSSPSSPYAKSCFFRWDHRGVPNSGVLIQAQDNPVPDEFPEWAAYYVQAKRNEGEKSPDGKQSYKYKKFDLGVDGAYSFELHRYLWRDANDFVYLIAFNLPSSEAEELQWAKKIGAEVEKNVRY